MRTFGSGRRLATAAVIAAAALGAAGPAQADGLGVGNPDCEQGAEGVVQQFREIEEQRGYDAAVKWWYKAWPKYHDRCVV